ncbi:MAG: trypsin-like peptidase domain-containing protein [Oscillospiraceae bacterium]|nr:trypsin-like peptidase domain-containing protein [Oscillospiraceae bacterium]
MYNDEFDRINGTYRYNRTSNLPQDDYRPSYTQPGPATLKKKEKQGVKIAALLLACAILGGLCGFGGAALQRNMHRGSAVIQQSDRAPVTVEVQKVDGQQAMNPAEVYASTVNSTVSINTATTRNVFGQVTESASSGSGFIITADGYIVTNHHVVNGASKVTVTLYNGEEYDATIIGGDADYDVAVIKIDGEELPAVTLGNSADVNVGDWVMAIGNPLGELTFSMSQGSVSSSGRAINVDGTPFNMLQVDCAINPGNSGGPLMNLYGEVVGIVSAKYSSYSNTTVEGLGFAIPISDVQAIITDIIENGAVTDKAYLAITAGTMTAEMAAQYSIDLDKGVFVYSVVKGGAGDRAGLRLGDIITELDGKTITDMTDLSMAKKGHKAGETVSLTYYRDGEYHETELTFDEQPETTGEEAAPVQPQMPEQYEDYYNQMPDGFEDFFRYFFGRGW